MTNTPTQEPALAPDLLERVLAKLGLHELPGIDLTGLNSVYAAISGNVSNDNVQKRIWLSGHRASPVSGGDPAEFFRNRNASSVTLREELGDADFERYLIANNRSTSVTVSSVIESSPAQSAGLQPGDEIVRYDGERVFSMSDLTRQTMDGTAGQTVVVDIMRNGNPMQIVLPRGPVGISGGRRSR